MNMETTIEHNEDEKTIRIFLNEESAGYLTYSVHDMALDIKHTVVDPKFRGKGLGRILVDNAIEYAEKEGLTIIPSCSYAERVMNDGN